jgi:hypothetical protein
MVEPVAEVVTVVRQRASTAEAVSCLTSLPSQVELVAAEVEAAAATTTTVLARAAYHCAT